MIEWIEVKKKLPKPGVFVIIALPMDHVAHEKDDKPFEVARMLQRDERPPAWEIDSYGGFGAIVGNEHYQPTHWSYINEPHKEESDG